jgi:hypothetical protein
MQKMPLTFQQKSKLVVPLNISELCQAPSYLIKH